MKKILVLCIMVVLFYHQAYPCSCIGWRTFCSGAKYSLNHNQYVFYGKITSIIENGIAIEVLEDFSGTETRNTITIWSANIIGCMEEQLFLNQSGSVGDSLFIIVDKITDENKAQEPYQDDEWFVTGDYRLVYQICNYTSILVRDKRVVDYENNSSLQYMADELAEVIRGEKACPIISFVTSASNENMIRVFPNPVSEKLTIESGMKNYEVYLYNAMGELVGVYEKPSYIDMHELKSGVYLLKIQEDDQFVFTGRVIKL
ncbi:MAG: T9SS type A sorting domain-containing protein [Cytophagaceae bacterium]